MRHAIVRCTVLVLAVSMSLSAYGENPAEQSSRPEYFMFVQTASSGSFTPIEGSTNSYKLVLEGVAPVTIYLSDRPARFTGHVPMAKFLDGLGFDDDNPPNAAIEVEKADGDTGIVVAELRKPQWDDGERRLTYEIRILEDATDGGLAHYDEKKEATLPAKFGAASMFIDDCPDKIVYCFEDTVIKDGGFNPFDNNPHLAVVPPCGSLPGKRGTCWDWANAACRLCKNPAPECGSATQCSHFGTHQDGTHPDEVAN